MKRLGIPATISLCFLISAAVFEGGARFAYGKSEREIKADLAACLKDCDAKNDLSKCNSNPPSKCVVARRACNSQCKDAAAKSAK